MQTLPGATLGGALVTQSMVAHAHQVVTNPNQYGDRPILRRLAWVTLMGARGCRVDQSRLAAISAERSK